MTLLKFYENYKFVLNISFGLLGYFFLVKKYHILPDYTLNLYSILSLMIGSYFFGNDSLNIERMKIYNTDWAKTESFFNTCTKIVKLSEWTIFYIGGFNSDSNFRASEDGSIIWVVPNSSFIKKGRVYDIRSKVEYCSGGILDLPNEAQTYLSSEKSSFRQIFFGNDPSGLFYFKPEFVSLEYVTTLQNHYNKLMTYVKGKLSDYEKFTSAYAGVRENLDPKKSSWFSLGEKNKND
jgi:hypothetical protein